MRLLVAELPPFSEPAKGAGWHSVIRLSPLQHLRPMVADTEEANRLMGFGDNQCVAKEPVVSKKAEFNAIVLNEMRMRLGLGASTRISEKCFATHAASDDI